MNTFLIYFFEPWMQRLGWVLIHFIWQGAAIAFFLAIALSLLPRVSSQIRYAVIAFALIVSAVMPIVTWAALGSSAATALIAIAPSLPVALPQNEMASSSVDSFPRKTFQEAGTFTKTSWPPDLGETMVKISPYAVGLWWMGVVILTGRLVLGWIWTQRLCRAGLPIPDLECLQRLRGLIDRMGVAVPVRLLQSVQVEVPTLIGWLRPTILIPVSVLAGLSPDQLEAILAHELAHVRRYDYLVNLLQTVMETILFYHPAIWWISRKLREERENCCDDIVLQLMQDRLVYASALAFLEDARPASFALTASGGSLLQRINRIAGLRRPKTPLLPVIITSLIIGFVAVPLIGQMVTATVKATGEGSKIKDSTLTRTLGFAAKQGDLAAVSHLLKMGADPNDYHQASGNYPFESNALLAAVESGHVDVVKLLLENGADPNWEKSDSGQFALSYAKNAAMVKTLLDGGADPNGKRDGPNDYTTPLMTAPDPESVRLLVQHGANINPKFANGLTLLENSITSELYHRSLGDRWDVVSEMIKQGAKFDPKGNGPTLLVDAAGQGYVNIARGLLDEGVNPDAYSDQRQESPLTSAAWPHSPEMIKLLLSRGAHHSANRGNSSPLSMALNWGRYEDATVLRQAGENDVGQFSEYCARGDLAKVDELLSAGADVNETDRFGQTPLMYAVRRGHTAIAEELLKHGANLDQFSFRGSTAYGEYQAFEELFKKYPKLSRGSLIQDDWGVRTDEATRQLANLDTFFKEHPSNPNYQDVSGKTGMHQAALTGNLWDLDLTLRSRPNVNLKDNNGNTPLLLAALSPVAGDLETKYVDKTSGKEWNAEAHIANELIKAGAKLDLLLANGKTVGDLAMAAAVSAKNPQLISVLRAAGVASVGGVHTTSVNKTESKLRPFVIRYLSKNNLDTWSSRPDNQRFNDALNLPQTWDTMGN